VEELSRGSGVCAVDYKSCYSNVELEAVEVYELYQRWEKESIGSVASRGTSCDRVLACI
jgi:hypothetical protein